MNEPKSGGGVRVAPKVRHGPHSRLHVLDGIVGAERELDVRPVAEGDERHAQQMARIAAGVRPQLGVDDDVVEDRQDEVELLLEVALRDAAGRVEDEDDVRSPAAAVCNSTEFVLFDATT